MLVFGVVCDMYSQSALHKQYTNWMMSSFHKNEMNVRMSYTHRKNERNLLGMLATSGFVYPESSGSSLLHSCTRGQTYTKHPYSPYLNPLCSCNISIFSKVVRILLWNVDVVIVMGFPCWLRSIRKLRFPSELCRLSVLLCMHFAKPVYEHFITLYETHQPNEKKLESK